jgi:Fe-S-cluster-containing dehydrogenase component/formate-dependent nitrite reductase membrane component NrfD
MRLGFAIDNRKCIGCHSCSVACKAENGVPLGVFRTWVKYVDKGRFPSSRRFFQVTRCNHCARPPCVEICPVGAMHKRADGIVDFDSSRCIGCKACLEACPYDAIYVDPSLNTAAKCNYCAHRVCAGLEPTCVVVCPEHAIIAGDLDDAGSEISQLCEREPTRVRRPEQGTSPNVFYVAAEETAIVPGKAANLGTYLWATVDKRRNRVLGGSGPLGGATPAVVSYDVAHRRPWDWQVPLYFFTKSISAGVLAVPALAAAALGLAVAPKLGASLSAIGLAFMALTVALLVSDLSKRGRFLRVVTSPQPRSWLARGAYLLVVYSGLLAAFGALSWFGAGGVAPALLYAAAIAGFLAGAYTAFLCGQCEGCDLWQTPLLPLHLVVQCAVAGSAVVALVPARLGGTPELGAIGAAVLLAGLVLHALALVGELAMPHATENARIAARLITRGPLGGAFWAGAVALGLVVPLALLAFGWGAPVCVGAAGGFALVGLLAFEWCFVMAGQGVANS